jgi:tRNA-splicing ligase RtcB
MSTVDKFSVHETGGAQLKLWDSGNAFEQAAMDQLGRTARLPIIHGHVAGMPDVHFGLGATIGSVIPTLGAIVPAAVGVDIGCGMVAQRTSLTADDMPSDLKPLYERICRAVPHGRTANGGENDRGNWSRSGIPASIRTAWDTKLDKRFESILAKYPKIGSHNAMTHLGSLGGGNHFVEVCLDEEDRVWVMLHSGSRGVGNRIGQLFIREAKEDMARSHQQTHLEDGDLSFLTENTKLFDDYIEAMLWAQDFAYTSRELMLARVLQAMRDVLPVSFQTDKSAVNCHHNYACKEHHFGEDVWVTRKGAVNAERGKLGIIPGSMGTGSYIVEGLGNTNSFNSCSHGAGRRMSRTRAKREISMDQHAQAMQGIVGRTDKDVIDESPAAYKSIETVMQAQTDLVKPKHKLRQIINVKG